MSSRLSPVNNITEARHSSIVNDDVDSSLLVCDVVDHICRIFSAGNIERHELDVGCIPKTFHLVHIACSGKDLTYEDTRNMSRLHGIFSQ